MFSLGVVLYELLTGRPPFTGDNAVEILDAILREDPLPAPELETGLGRELERVHEVLPSLTGGNEQADEAFAASLGRELGARWIVSGDYQRQGDAVRVTARVVDPRTGTVVHTVKVDGTMAGLFELQDRIVGEVTAGESRPYSFSPDAVFISARTTTWPAGDLTTTSVAP